MPKASACLRDGQIGADGRGGAAGFREVLLLQPGAGARPAGPCGDRKRVDPAGRRSGASAAISTRPRAGWRGRRRCAMRRPPSPMRGSVSAASAMRGSPHCANAGSSDLATLRGLRTRAGTAGRSAAHRRAGRSGSRRFPQAHRSGHALRFVPARTGVHRRPDRRAAVRRK